MDGVVVKTLASLQCHLWLSVVGACSYSKVFLQVLLSTKTNTSEFQFNLECTAPFNELLGAL